MSKSMKKLKPLEIRFGEDFEGFWEAKWSQVGTKMASQIDLILKTPNIKNENKNQWNFNDCGGSRDAKIDEQSNQI